MNSVSGLLKTGLLVGLILMAGCARVPQVEQRLQTLHFQPNTYVVQSGDTMESIAFRYRMNVDQLVSLNRHLGPEISPGERLIVKRDAGNDGYEQAFTGQGWYRDAPVSAIAQRNQGAVRDVTVHPTDEHADKFPVQWREGVIPGDAEKVEIQAAYRGETTLREDIISEAELEQLLASESVGTQHDVPLVETSRADQGSGVWAWPASGNVVRDYAPDRLNGQGIDIAGRPGDYVVAATAGTVQYTGRDLSNSGNLVIIRHANGLLTTYSHLKDFYVTENEYVAAGQDIASLGWNTERESVLHFEVRKDGKPVNPLKVLPRQ